YVTPKPEHYNYDMLDGIEYTIKVSNPVGERIIALSYQGKPIKEDDTFTLVLNNYRAAGGGNFSMLRNCKVLEDQQKDVVDCLMEYIMSNPEIRFEHKDNIKVIV
ncbi:MAG: 5'-nucleotidase C-terminal domain-containing protein, partial [Erysipelotrichales bacterium]|nr:5'-nucleotidase C-terminal domain-containing protein [Erysipelotrichales bacterium]